MNNIFTGSLLCKACLSIEERNCHLRYSGMCGGSINTHRNPRSLRKACKGPRKLLRFWAELSWLGHNRPNLSANKRVHSLQGGIFIRCCRTLPPYRSKPYPPNAYICEMISHRDSLSRNCVETCEIFTCTYVNAISLP